LGLGLELGFGTKVAPQPPPRILNGPTIIHVHLSNVEIMINGYNVSVYCSCTLQSECSNADGYNHWKSRLTGTYNNCVNITSIQPASHWPVQHSVNVRYNSCNYW